MNRLFIPFIIVGAACAVLTGCIRFAMLPLAVDIAHQRAELARYRALTAESGGYANVRGKIGSEHDSLRRISAGLTAGLGDAADLSRLLKMLIGKASEADVRFVKIEPQQQSEELDFIRYPVVLEMSTSYHALGRLVASLENMPNVLRVERMAVSAQSSGAVSVKLLVTCFLQRNG